MDPSASQHIVTEPWRKYFEEVVYSIMDRNIDVYQEGYYLNIEVNALQEQLKEAIGNRIHKIETQEPKELKKEEGLSTQCVAEEVLQGNEALKGETQSLQVMVENDRPDSVQVQGLQEVQANQNINEMILQEPQELKKEEGLSALRDEQESLKSEPLTSDQQEMHDINQLLEMNRILKEKTGKLQQVNSDLLNNMFVVKERLGHVLQGNEALKKDIQRLQVMVENDRPDSVQGQGLQEVQADQNINEMILQEPQELKKEEGLSALRDEQESLKSEPLTSDQQEMHDINQLLEMNRILKEKTGKLQQVNSDLLNNMFVVKERLGHVLQGNEALKKDIQRLQEPQELKKEEGLSALRDEQESLKSEPLTSDQQEMTNANQQVQADEKIDEGIVQEVQEEGHSGHREDQESLENKPLRRFFVRLFGMRKMRRILSWRPTCTKATV
ncbi:hypothetical protein D9C73_005658 [Collichthys lucidus]|uniref:Uncharacterized protein n=1 Tax=Collichthys lucidus TaxID=240159 RepID=A0A4U5U976_COLLU|nr:hypothetical protein D9C73_005658 [Collichthys lucidus]